jgi:hypothetical protein
MGREIQKKNKHQDLTNPPENTTPSKGTVTGSEKEIVKIEEIPYQEAHNSMNEKGDLIEIFTKLAIVPYKELIPDPQPVTDKQKNKENPQVLEISPVDQAPPAQPEQTRQSARLKKKLSVQYIIVRPFFARSAPPLGDGMRKKDTEIPPKRAFV